MVTTKYFIVLFNSVTHCYGQYGSTLKLILIAGAVNSSTHLKMHAICSILKQHFSHTDFSPLPFPLSREACQGFGTSESIKKV